MVGISFHRIIKIEKTERKLDDNSYSTTLHIYTKEYNSKHLVKNDITLFSNKKINLTVL